MKNRGKAYVSLTRDGRTVLLSANIGGRVVHTRMGQTIRQAALDGKIR